MARSEWDPLKELETVQRRMNQLFESAMDRTNFDAEGGFGSWVPSADLYETGDEVVAFVELPGIPPADVSLRLDGDALVIEGERRMERAAAGEQYHRVERSYGRFQRKLALPSGVDRDSASATFKDGVLVVTLRKAPDERTRPIKLEIR
jgi:HSP20 family protein